MRLTVFWCFVLGLLLTFTPKKTIEQRPSVSPQRSDALGRRVVSELASAGDVWPLPAKGVEATEHQKQKKRYALALYFFFLVFGFGRSLYQHAKQKKRKVFEIENKPKKKRFPFLNLNLISK